VVVPLGVPRQFFGLGFATCRAEDSSSIDFVCSSAMVKGGSPTYGFLTFGTEGSHTGFLFEWMAPAGPESINAADVAFMAALLLAGVALMLGIGTRIAAVGAAIRMAFMFLAGDVWSENNPVTSSHIIEMVVLLGIATVGSGAFSIQG
jgi:thiosulfate dehydrogenase [quinone] large subunit